MTVSKAKQAATLRYRAKTYDRVSIDVPKGKRAAYNEKAAAIGISLAQLIQRAVEAYDGEEMAETNTVGEKIPIEDKAEHSSQQITGEELKLLTIFKSLSPKTQKNLLKFLESLQD